MSTLGTCGTAVPAGGVVPLSVRAHIAHCPVLEIDLSHVCACACRDMFSSLARLMKRGTTSYGESARRDWVLNNFAQIVMTVRVGARGAKTAI